MNRLFTFFQRHFASATLTPGTRLIALGLIVLQAPLAILTALLFFLLPITFPILILYYCYWQMYRQKISRAAARAAWVATAMYHSFLWALVLLVSGEFHFFVFLPFALTVATALIAWADLRDKDDLEIAESILTA